MDTFIKQTPKSGGVLQCKWMCSLSGNPLFKTAADKIVKTYDDCRLMYTQSCVVESKLNLLKNTNRKRSNFHDRIGTFNLWRHSRSILAQEYELMFEIHCSPNTFVLETFTEEYILLFMRILSAKIRRYTHRKCERWILKTKFFFSLFPSFSLANGCTRRA